MSRGIKIIDHTILECFEKNDIRTVSLWSIITHVESARIITFRHFKYKYRNNVKKENDNSEW